MAYTEYPDRRYLFNCQKHVQSGSAVECRGYYGDGHGPCYCLPAYRFIGRVSAWIHGYGHCIPAGPCVPAWRRMELAANDPLWSGPGRDSRSVAGLVDFIPRGSFFCYNAGGAADVSRRGLFGNRWPDRGTHGQDLPNPGRWHQRIHRGDLELDSGRCGYRLDTDSHRNGSPQRPKIWVQSKTALGAAFFSGG